MANVLERCWYNQHPLSQALRPLSWGFKYASSLRRRYLQKFRQQKSAVPIIVVGNVTVGGVGKTPLVIALAKRLQAQGIRVGIVSRGYRASIKSFPHKVQLTDTALEVGDEPLLIAQKTQCPVVIAPQRNAAVDYLIAEHQCQIILSDDGLQHYRMGRAVEIVVIDGIRGLGNGLCLPAGPLRESAQRLSEVDFLVVNEGAWANAYSMTLRPGKIKSLVSEQTKEISQFNGSVAAIAAIGNPQRFYNTLSLLGLKFNPYSYPDHYHFKADDLHYTESEIIMTEKDAVKCRLHAKENWYYLPVEAELDETFWQALVSHPQLKGYF